MKMNIEIKHSLSVEWIKYTYYDNNHVMSNDPFIIPDLKVWYCLGTSN